MLEKKLTRAMIIEAARSDSSQRVSAVGFRKPCPGEMDVNGTDWNAAIFGKST
jgi:hypothetical protein